jgi:hypothetical protein
MTQQNIIELIDTRCTELGWSERKILGAWHRSLIGALQSFIRQRIESIAKKLKIFFDTRMI